MRLTADESVDKAIVDRLRQQGHEIEYVAELEPGIVDDEVLLRSWRAGQLLITADKDLGELVSRQNRTHAGILLLRLTGLTPEQKADLVEMIFRQSEARLTGRFSVLSERALRIRESPPL